MTAFQTLKSRKTYLVNQPGGESEISFDYVYETAIAIAESLNNSYLKPSPSDHGTDACFEKYRSLTSLGSDIYRSEGTKCNALLNPALVGLEGKRLQARDSSGLCHRFYLELSPGWLPCHVKKKTKASDGGEGIPRDEKFVEIKIVKQR
jgi:hypothetical protein